jgi:hypothetical protein
LLRKCQVILSLVIWQANSRNNICLTFFIKVDTKKDSPQDNSIPTLADGEIDKQISVEEFKLCLTEDLKENE